MPLPSSTLKRLAFNLEQMEKLIEPEMKTTHISCSLCCVPGISQCPRCPQPSCHACVLSSADQQKQWPRARGVCGTYRVFYSHAGRELWRRYVVLLSFFFFFFCRLSNGHGSKCWKKKGWGWLPLPVSSHFRGTPVGWKYLLKTTEMKTSARISFTRTLFVPWIQFMVSTIQDHGKGLKLEKIGQCFQVWAQYMDSDPGKVHWCFSIDFKRNIVTVAF